LLALALVLEGYSRSEAATLSGMDRQTLRDWVHRYNADGVDGLKSRHSSGRPPALSEEQKAQLLELVLKGPDPETDKVVRWRCVDLQAEVARRFSVEVHENTIGRWLHELGLTRLQPRPFNPKKDAEAEAAFKKLLRPSQSRAPWRQGRRPYRNMVPRRGPGGSAGNPRLHLGSGWLPPADGAR
jgi:transposase